MDRFIPLFAVPMGVFKIPEDMISNLEKSVYHFKKDKGYDWSNNLAGQIHDGSQTLLPHTIVTGFPPWDAVKDRFVELITKETIEYAGACYDTTGINFNQMKPEGVKVELDGIWATIQKPGDYNPVHTHDGHIAGTAFVKVPKHISRSTREEQIENNEELDMDGSLNFIYGRSWSIENFSLGGSYRVDPEVGSAHIFPCWLNHVVYPFKGDSTDLNHDRISIAWNFRLVWD